MDFKENILPLLNAVETGIEMTKREIPLPITSPVFINKDTLKNPWIIFKDITFESFISISDASFNIGIGFINCTFKRAVVFDNIVCGKEIDEKFNKDSKSIFFKSCEFSKNVIFKGDKTTIEKDISFEDNCKLKEGLVLLTIHAKQNIHIHKSEISVKADFVSNRIDQDLRITESTFNCPVRFEDGLFSVISIIQSTFKKELKFWDCQIIHRITFNDGEYEGDVSLRTIKAEANAGLSIIGGKFKEIVYLLYQDPNEPKKIVGFRYLYFRSCDFDNGLNVIGALIDEPVIEKIQLRVSSKMQGDIAFNSLHVGKFEISGINSKATIKLQDISVNVFKIHDFYNHSYFMLTGIKPSYKDWFEETKLENGQIARHKNESLISFLDSNLGKTQLFVVDFQSFSQVRLRNIGISEIIASGIRWFNDDKLFVVGNFTNDLLENIKNHHGGKIPIDNTAVLDFRARIEIYRQLKLACEKQGDRFQSLEFHKREMIFYKKFLKIVKPDHWNDLFVLYSGETNNFGQSWKKATWLGLIFTFLLYIPIQILGSDTVFTHPNFCICTKADDLFLDIIKNLPKYFQLLNPTHNLSHIYNLKDKPESIHIFDFAHRLVTAFFVFQIVSAFRKLIK